ncbi:hypothetical protein [Streptomyces sirii]|uniref:hypothetical protein n=1 Tax=Streptomyces sirii TaxID=3127701 RepID=UPI003D368C30
MNSMKKTFTRTTVALAVTSAALGAGLLSAAGSAWAADAPISSRAQVRIGVQVQGLGSHGRVGNSGHQIGSGVAQSQSVVASEYVGD